MTDKLHRVKRAGSFCSEMYKLGYQITGADDYEDGTLSCIYSIALEVDRLSKLLDEKEQQIKDLRLSQ